MSTCVDLRRQAACCLRVAAAVTAVDDGTTAAALVAIADDFSAQADQIDPTLESTSLDPASLESSRRSASGGTLSGDHAADDAG
jgi:hypothetical protein